MRNPPRTPSGKDSRTEVKGLLCVARHPSGNRANVEIKTSIFPNGKLITYLMTPESVRGASCTLFAQKLAVSEKIVTVFFALQLLRDYGARHIEVVIGEGPQQARAEMFLVDLLREFADVRITSEESNESTTRHSQKGAESAPRQARPADRNATEQCADLVLYTPSTAQFFGSDDGSGLIEIDSDGTVSLPAAVTRGLSILLVHSTDRGKGLVQLFEILFELRKRQAHLAILLPRFAYARQHKPYVTKHLSPETDETEMWYSANSINAILTALSRYASRLYTINAHYGLWGSH
jgi:hypothetical protein